MDSILTSIKKLLGIMEDQHYFDNDIIMHINSVLMTLTQLGVGPDEGFMIEDEYATWSDLLPEGMQLEAVKSYIYLKVRLLFDPPVSGIHVDAINRQIAEYEWRINVMVDRAGMEE